MFHKMYVPIFAVVLLFGGAFYGAPALAVTIDPGFDLFATPAGFSWADLPGIGRVDLQGNPFGPADTDTIVERQGPPITLTNLGDVDTMPIELVALSLKSIAPVDLGGGVFGDIYVTINHTVPPIPGLPEPIPVPPSVGSIEITYNGTNGGTFTSFFDVFADIIITTIGGDPNNASDVINVGTFQDTFTTAPTLWSTTPRWDDPHNAMYPAGGFYPGVDPNNPCNFDPGIPGCGPHDGKVLTQEEALLAQHGVLPAQVPEIDAASSTGALSLLLGALALVGERRRRRTG